MRWPQKSAAKAKVDVESASQRLGRRAWQRLRFRIPSTGLGGGYDFDVPLLAGDHVTDDAGTGFVHTAPGHGREDFDVWMDAAPELRERGIDTRHPLHRRRCRLLHQGRAGLRPDREGGAARVIDDNGKKGDANQAVIDALIERNMLFARGRLKHSYPHRWRSKKPVIFRNTPQWFVHMDKELRRRHDAALARARRDRRHALRAGGRADPPARHDRGAARLGAVAPARLGRADRRLRRRRRQRAEGRGGQPSASSRPSRRRAPTPGSPRAPRSASSAITTPTSWTKVEDILDVWFDSGSTHAFTLEDRPDLKWPADVYLEGSDQHRGWFHSSLLESCGTRGRAPYDTVVTHGFTMDEDGRKMSKSLGNTVVPQDVIKQSGADILRLWVVTTDYWEDQRLGKNVLQTNIDAYRKLRNTIRWMLGTLAHDEGEDGAAGETCRSWSG